jgi:hypothetical protein
MRKVGFVLHETVQLYPGVHTRIDVRGNTEGLMEIRIADVTPHDEPDDDEPEKMSLSISEARAVRDMLNVVCAIDETACPMRKSAMDA